MHHLWVIVNRLKVIEEHKNRREKTDIQAFTVKLKLFLQKYNH